MKRKDLKLPPQLIGVHEDALRIMATAFKIERMRTLVMASCSSPNQAMEIDFEPCAGQEMIDYIVAQSDLRNREGRFALEYEGRRFDCAVTADRNRDPIWVNVSWESGNQPGAEPPAGG